MRFQLPADVPAPCWLCEGYKYPDGSIQRVLQAQFPTRLRIYSASSTIGWRVACPEAARVPLAHERVRFQTHCG